MGSRQRVWSWLLFLACCLAGTIASAEEAPFEPSPDWPSGHYARIETDLGRIVARLLPGQAPQSVAHFAAMAKGELAWTDPTGEQKQFPFYDGIPIHNVRAGLLFEAGDWTGTGKGAPPLYVPDEGHGPINFSQGGRLGMARPQRRPSAVQFFVTYAASPRLNRAFPCFGEVVEGREVVFQISQQKSYGNGLVHLVEVDVAEQGGDHPALGQPPFSSLVRSRLSSRAAPDGGPWIPCRILVLSSGLSRTHLR